MFQSTPVIANGRILAYPIQHPGAKMFQYTPVIANGRIFSMPSCASILRCFNPRPLLLTGESDGYRRRHVQPDVSIHARYC